MNVFGMELKQLRIQRGLTLRELATAAQVDYTYLSKIENNRVAPPRPKVIERLAVALNVPVGRLLVIRATLGLPEAFRAIWAIFETERSRGLTDTETREINRIIREGPDATSDLLQFFQLVEGASFGDPRSLRRVTRNLEKVWVTLPESIRRSVWRLLYFFLHDQVSYRVVNPERVMQLLQAQKQILFVGFHQDIPALLGYLLGPIRRDIQGLTELFILVSGNFYGEEITTFVKKAPLPVEVVSWPTLNMPQSSQKRRLAFRNFLERFKKSNPGTAAVMVLDEYDGKNRRLLREPFILARESGAFIVPVVAGSKAELRVERSWDKQRIPLWACTIFVGAPFEAQGEATEDSEAVATRQLSEMLTELDMVARAAIRPEVVRVGV